MTNFVIQVFFFAKRSGRIHRCPTDTNEVFLNEGCHIRSFFLFSVGLIRLTVIIYNVRILNKDSLHVFSKILLCVLFLHLDINR